MKVLHVSASPRADSLSRRVSGQLVSMLCRLGDTVSCLERDLAAHPVPHITQAWTEICDNLMADGITALERLGEGARTPAQQEAWAIVSPLLQEVVDADLVVLSTPMYNYSVPSSLKAWLDQITFPRMDLRPRQFVVVAARGGSYAPGSPKEHVEHQVRYLSDFLTGHFSVEAPDVITVELGNARVDPQLAEFLAMHAASLQQALRWADELAGALHGLRRTA